MVLLMIAGIDTSWSAIGASLWHLAGHAADRRRLATEPGLMDTALEEFLRAYAPVTMARLVAKDCDFHGHQLKEGDWLLLPFPPPIVTPAHSRTRTGCCSTGPRTGTPRSVSAGTGAWAPTWLAWSSGWRWRSGSRGTRTSSSPTRPRWPGPAAR